MKLPAPSRGSDVAFGVNVLFVVLFLAAAMTHGRPPPPATVPAAAPSTPYGLTGRPALAAFKEYEAARARAQAAYEKAVAPAQAKLLADLNKAREAATRAGDLDEAVRLRDAAADLTAKGGGGPADPEPPAPRLAKLLPGTRWQKAAGGFAITFADGGVVTSTHHPAKGTWAAVGDDGVRVSISMDGCKGDDLKIGRDGKALVNAAGAVDFTLAGR